MISLSTIIPSLTQYRPILSTSGKNSSIMTEYLKAGKTARKIFGPWKGSAGGHSNAARAEIPLENIFDDPEDESGLAHLLKQILKDMKP